MHAACLFEISTPQPNSPPLLITPQHPPLFISSSLCLSHSEFPPRNGLSLSLSHSKFPPHNGNLLLSSPYNTQTSPPFHSIHFLSSSGDFFLHMGTCFSTTETDSASYSALTASVITANGALRQYPLPINASQVLGLETTSPSSFFICNSDNLYFDQYIPPIDSAQQLDAGQIYFVLPFSRLQYPLTAREMAAMAVKASSALVEGSKKNGHGRRSRRVRISPVSDLGEKLENEYEGKRKSFGMMESDAGMGGRSKYLKRVMSRSASRKGKVWQRQPFRATLSTIHEGLVAV